MFGLDISSNYIKYIGLLIVGILITLILISIYNVIDDGVHDFFGIKTKEEKAASLKLDKEILKANNEELKKDIVITTKINDIKNETAISYSNKNNEDKKVIKKILDKAKKIHKPTIKSTSYISKNLPLKTKKINLIKPVKKHVTKEVEKQETIDISIPKQEYEEYGSDNINAIYEMYNFVKDNK